jgi:hypothetical protein
MSLGYKSRDGQVTIGKIAYRGKLHEKVSTKTK